MVRRILLSVDPKKGREWNKNCEFTHLQGTRYRSDKDPVNLKLEIFFSCKQSITGTKYTQYTTIDEKFKI